jgi:hypothetical protein
MAPPPPVAPERDQHGSKEGGGSALSSVLLGTGVAALGVGLVTGALALSKKSTVKEHCDANKQCDSDGLAAADSGKTFSTISTVAFVGAGVSLGAWLFVGPSSGGGAPQSSATRSPSVIVNVGGQF